MENIEGGELYEYIVDRDRIPEAEACHIFHQLILAIEKLEFLGISHRDIKPENILLDSQKNIKVIDFGLGRTYKPQEMLLTACGSPCYAAPEMVSRKPYNGTMVDIWSSGVTLFAMLGGHLPFDDDDLTTLYDKIVKGDYKIDFTTSPEAKDLITKILQTDPTKRLTINQIKAHPWMKMRFLFRMRKQNKKIYQEERIDYRVIDKLAECGVDPELVLEHLRSNRHNMITTTYYLLAKQGYSDRELDRKELRLDSFLKEHDYFADNLEKRMQLTELSHSEVMETNIEGFQSEAIEESQVIFRAERATEDLERLLEQGTTPGGRQIQLGGEKGTTSKKGEDIFSTLKILERLSSKKKESITGTNLSSDIQDFSSPKKIAGGLDFGVIQASQIVLEDGAFLSSIRLTSKGDLNETPKLQNTGRSRSSKLKKSQIIQSFKEEEIEESRESIEKESKKEDKPPPLAQEMPIVIQKSQRLATMPTQGAIQRPEPGPDPLNPILQLETSQSQNQQIKVLNKGVGGKESNKASAKKRNMVRRGKVKSLKKTNYQKIIRDSIKKSSHEKSKGLFTAANQNSSTKKKLQRSKERLKISQRGSRPQKLFKASPNAFKGLKHSLLIDKLQKTRRKIEKINSKEKAKKRAQLLSPKISEFTHHKTQITSAQKSSRVVWKNQMNQSHLRKSKNSKNSSLNSINVSFNQNDFCKQFEQKYTRKKASMQYKPTKFSELNKLISGAQNLSSINNRSLDLHSPENLSEKVKKVKMIARNFGSKKNSLKISSRASKRKNIKELSRFDKKGPLTTGKIVKKLMERKAPNSRDNLKRKILPGLDGKKNSVEVSKPFITNRYYSNNQKSQKMNKVSINSFRAKKRFRDVKKNGKSNSIALSSLHADLRSKRGSTRRGAKEKNTSSMTGKAYDFGYSAKSQVDFNSDFNSDKCLNSSKKHPTKKLNKNLTTRQKERVSFARPQFKFKDLKNIKSSTKISQRGIGGSRHSGLGLKNIVSNTNIRRLAKAESSALKAGKKLKRTYNRNNLDRRLNSKKWLRGLKNEKKAKSRQVEMNEPIPMDYLSFERPEVLIEKIEKMLNLFEIKSKRREMNVTCTKNNLRFYLEVQEVTQSDGIYTCRMTYPENLKPENEDLVKGFEYQLKKIFEN